MSIKIGSNISSLQAQRQLGTNSAALDTVFQRLSSGLRINTASDDAAGLSVAASLNVQKRVYQQGVRNLNDGISYINVLDGATSSLKTMLTRMAELAEQAANGSVSTAQRQSLDKEMTQLRKEYQRIIQSTEFQGVNVFGVDTISLQAGMGVGGQFNLSLGNMGSNAGTFTAGQAVGSASSPQQVVTADFNGDGTLDLASINTTNLLSVYIGNGDGTFNDRTTMLINFVGTTQSLATGDFNGDGAIDLVTNNYLGTGASIFLNRGDGTFQSVLTVYTPTNNTAVETGDFNGDGKSDLLVGANGTAINVFVNNGDGTFSMNTSFSGGSSISDFKTADFNNDGKLDFVWGLKFAALIGVKLGNGDGSFKNLPNTLTRFSSYSNPQGVAVGDMNDDGNVDILTAGGSGNTLDILLGNGDGTFKSPTSFVDTGTALSVSVADLNGDGFLDAVTSGSTSNTLSVFLGNGDGTFRARSTVATGAGPYDVAIGDFNNDSRTDLVSANSTAGTLGVLYGNGNAYLVKPLTGIDVKSRTSALATLTTVKDALEQLNLTSSIFGAAQSRLEIGIRHLRAQSVVTAEAEDRIMSADIASESAQLMRTKIIQQATSAVLAQANQQPALALYLLKN